MNAPALTTVEINHAHIFCGIGGGARGFNRGEARVGNLQARFRCLGGIDVNAAVIRDFGRIAGVPGTVLDLFSRDQYRDFHGHEPPDGWREAVPDDVRRAFGNQHPHILFLSAPCKGFSGLLSETASRAAKYQALNGLTLRGIFLALEAYRDDPVELIIFENVPRIATRGRHLLDQIVALLRAYGYAVAETTHDCGEIGGLAQSRKRFLLVARYAAKVPNFLYEPVKHRLRGVGEVLDRLPLPLSGIGGPMHRMPSLQWKTWVRLAFVRAGSDWRSLNDLAIADGFLRDFGIAAEYGFRGTLGVTEWGGGGGGAPAPDTGGSRPTTGHHAVADPRFANWHPGASSAKLRVSDWDDPSFTVTGAQQVASGALSVADPRVDGHPRSVQLGVRPWNRPAGVVTGKMIAGGGPNSVADPRLGGRPRFNNTFRIVPWGEASPAVAGPGGPAGGLAVADPRPAFARDGREQYLSGGHYGVVPFDSTTRAVVGTGQHDNGPWSVADPRTLPNCANSQTETNACLPAADDRLVCVIRALDGTWHRPFTTLELAALQSLVDPDEFLELDGLSDSAWRERIGNMVPPAAAQAVAGVMGRALLGAWSGQTFQLSSEPIWVRPVAVALMAAPAPAGEATA